MHHLTLHHGPSSRLVASDVMTDFTSLTTNQLLGLQKTLAEVKNIARKNYVIQSQMSTTNNVADLEGISYPDTRNIFVKIDQPPSIS